MTVYYLDPEGGDDSNNGESFANRRKKIINVNGNSEIRIMKSPEPTSLGNGSWEICPIATGNGTNQTTVILEDSIRHLSSSTFDGQSSGNPTTVAKSNHGLSTGDTIWVKEDDESYAYAGVHQITKVDDDNFTLDGTENAADTASYTTGSVWKLNPFCVRLASSPIKNIICHQGLDGSGDKDWTIDQGTGGRDTGRYQSGYFSGRWFKPGNNVNGKVAHIQLDNALDLSGYQQISLRYFWEYISSGNKSQEDVFSLRLCSDTDGNTTVHTVPIKPPAGDDVDKWGWYTHDFGTNLNSSIQSIALYADKAMQHASNEIILDNVIACKAKSSADSLHHGSIIGKGTTHMSNWYPILAIVDKVVVFQTYWNPTNGLDDYTRPNVVETTETVTTYKRECFTRPEYYDSSEHSDSPFIQIANDHNVTISGGWNTTDMSTQDTNAGSWLALQSGMYSGIMATQITDGSYSNIGVVRGLNQYYISVDNGGGGEVTNCQGILADKTLNSSDYTIYDNCKTFGCTIFGTNSVNNTPCNNLIKNCTFINSYNINDQLRGVNTWDNCTFIGEKLPASFLFGLNKGKNIYSNCTFKHIYSILHGEDFAGHHSFTNCSFEKINTILQPTPDQDDGKWNDELGLPTLSFINYNNTANDHRLYFMNGLMTSDTSITQSGSGLSWKWTPLSVTQDVTRTALNPLPFKLAEVYVAANSQVTATIYARRNANNTDDYVALAALAKDNSVVGITTDVKSSALSGSVNTWQQLTLNFTPTKEGVATITALMSANATSDSVWVDTLEIT